ncbi:MAG: pilus assembly PilX N-terminal domain-containing protein [Candidatus Eisenbacteria bacterium]|nr:pilus assembly PilX N-terminal domain-containing protein [Candidatus Eisenbacteria bacterium]
MKRAGRNRPAGKAFPRALPAGRARERGSALLVALLILGALSMIATSLVMSSVTERHSSGYYRESLQALAAAETGLAFAKRAVQDLAAPMEDVDSDGRPDFRMSDTLSWNGRYELVAEATDIAGQGIAAYRSNGYTIVVQGMHENAARRVRAQIVHDSFLKYARFVAATGTSWSCGAILTGEVYAGGDLSVPNNCGADMVQFLEFVATTGDIPNAAYALFYRGYVTGADPIDLQNSVDFASYRSRAQGTAPECDCEGAGDVGLYISPPSYDPLAIGAGGTLDFSLFDFCNTTLAPGDTIITYNNAAVRHGLTGALLRNSEFNGVIFFENDGRVKGRLDGRSGRCLSVFATDDIIVADNITTGHRGFDPSTGLPNGSGDPVNLGLIASDYIYLDRYTPRVLRVDAAIMSCNSNWRVSGGTMADHPVCTGPIDLDCDGINGETPVNDDPRPGEGWDELHITSATWVLNINGPTITYNGGDAWPWNDSSVLAGASGPTRRYNYDMDVTLFPPPCFPVPLNLWKDVTWTEIFEVESDLASHLPQ